MLCSACLYPIIFLLAIVLLFRLEKIDPNKEFYAKYPNQTLCYQKLFRKYTQNSAVKAFDNLPVIIHQCSRSLLRSYYETIRAGGRSILYLSREQVEKNKIFSQKAFETSEEEQCAIVHVTQQIDDIRLELKMKEKYPSCKLVKVSSTAFPDADNNVEVVRAKLTMTFDKTKILLNQKTIDLETFLRVYLNKRIIEALYLDDSVPIQDFLSFSMNNESTKWFPACQLTVTLTRPKSKNEEIDIWNFIQRIIMKTGMVVVDCKPVNKDALNVVFYNVMHDYCTFKHFSIPFDVKGIKF